MGIALSEYSLLDDFKENMEVAYIKGRSPSLHRVLQGFSAALPIKSPGGTLTAPFMRFSISPKGIWKSGGNLPRKILYIYVGYFADGVPEIPKMNFMKNSLWNLKYSRESLQESFAEKSKK